MCEVILGIVKRRKPSEKNILMIFQKHGSVLKISLGWFFRILQIIKNQRITEE